MINLQLINAYLRHYLTSNTRHGTHSPFVYTLVDEVIYDFSEKLDYKDVEAQRNQLLADSRAISITDLGAGSLVNNNKSKQVKQLAKNALKPPKLAQLIYRLCNVMRPSNIVELGTCLGITTAYLAKAAPNGRVITIEGCPQTAAIASENIKSLNCNNVELKVGNFDFVLPEILTKIDVVDFAFVDGNHRKEATLTYFHLLLEKVNEKSILIFDDIYWSKGMEEAWYEIKKHPSVTVTVDLFWIGLVLFKKDQAKQDFKIKV